jgi:LDH2 family malate/lactate/ureidoglycolate dehydrogenase
MSDPPTGMVIRVAAARLRACAAQRLLECGVPPEDARLVAESLVQTSLWGIDSHGIARLPHYLQRLRAGSIECRPKLEFHRTGPCTGRMDGGHGLGIVVCHRAMDRAIKLAQENGVGIVGCWQSSHCGAVGLFGRQAANRGLVGIALTHSDAFVAPHHGRRPFLGTNPICIAAPSADGEPVCVDMATSAIPINRVLNARREGTALPPGVALDSNGSPTTDAHADLTLLPIGGHKGYALAFLIDILCGPLNGMPYGPHIPAMYGDLSARRNLGALLAAIDPLRFFGGEAFSRVVAEMAREARLQPSISDAVEVLVPGDPEYRTQRVREMEGIPLDAVLLTALGLTGQVPPPKGADFGRSGVSPHEPDAQSDRARGRPRPTA